MGQLQTGAWWPSQAQSCLVATVTALQGSLPCCPGPPPTADVTPGMMMTWRCQCLLTDSRHMHAVVCTVQHCCGHAAAAVSLMRVQDKKAHVCEWLSLPNSRAGWSKAYLMVASCATLAG